MNANRPRADDQASLDLAFTRPVATEPSGNFVRYCPSSFFWFRLVKGKNRLPSLSSSFSTSTSIVEPSAARPMSMKFRRRG